MLLSFILLIISSKLSAQVTGKVFDLDQKPLSHVSIWVENSKMETSSNELGDFKLNLSEGEYVLVFQQIGFEKLKKKIKVSHEPVDLIIQLSPAIYELAELEFTSKREDPANDIIRKAIESKKNNQKSAQLYKNHAYTKGIIKILEAPRKLLGQEIGNLGGALDTIGKGILYQSEAESILEKRNTSEYKETMISSRVAGNDRGFSFNRASSLDFNLYHNTTTFGKAIISPIADFAFGHYKFKLIGSNVSKDGYVIDKIQLIPKISTDAVWQGYIFINEKDYSIYEFDGFILGTQCKQELFDTITLSQNFVEISDLDLKTIRNQTFKFTALFFGFKIEGKFFINFSNFEKLNEISTGNRNEVLEILELSNKKSLKYWDSIRPIPLLTEEIRNYQIKDSIRLYKETKGFKDSMDRISNRLNYGNLLTGYTYSNSIYRRYIDVESPMNTLYFNPIQGLVLGTKIKFIKFLNENSRTQKFNIHLNLQYGIADETFRSDVKVGYFFDKIKHKRISLNLGRKLLEFDPSAETNNFYNQISALYFKNNVIKYFDQQFFEALFESDLDYSSRMYSLITVARRKMQINHSNYSFFRKSDFFKPNFSTKYHDSLLLLNNQATIKLTNIYVLNPFTKIWKSPEGIQKIGSDWPAIRITPVLTFYQEIKALSLLCNFRLEYNFDVGRWGRLFSSLELNKNFGQIPDIPEAIHPNSNPFSVSDIKSNLNFKVLRLYQKIGYSSSAELHIEHHLEGILFDRIPIIRHLGFKEVLGFSTLTIDKDRLYSEFSIGIENIGYKGFRFFRLDWIRVINGNEWGASYLRLGLINFLQIGK